MKEFIKIGNHLIRISIINEVYFNEPGLFVQVNDSICSYLHSKDDYLKTKEEVENILLEKEPESCKPKDYDLVLKFCHRIFDYYNKQVGDKITSRQMRIAIWNIEDLDSGPYGSYKIYSEIAIQLGILSKPNTQHYRLEV